LEDEVVRACGTCGKMRNYTLWLEGLSIDGRITLNWTLDKYNWKEWAKFVRSSDGGYW
jgi:hypothetical protein